MTTLKINGTEVSLTEYDVWPSRYNRRLGGISTMTLTRKGGPTIKPASSLLGSTVQLLRDGTPIFTGDVVDLDHQWTNAGWVKLYQCRCLRGRGDQVPFTDSATLTDEAVWNLPMDDALFRADRAGKNIGEIIADALTMEANATALNTAGIGGYTSLDPPTLPADTVSDLAALTSMPPQPASISGGKCLSAIQSYLGSVAPNHAMVVQADGVIRFHDMRAVAEHTLTLGVDPVEPTPLKRSVADCFQRIVVRGMPIAEPKLVSTSNGGLAEAFAWGPYLTNAAAKAAWTPEDFRRDEDARSTGTCVCDDTLNVTLTSNPATQAWATDEWDATHRMGSILLSSTVTTGVEQRMFKRIVSNTSKSSGGTSTVTLESPLPSTGYDSYQIYGISSGASLVYRRYKITDGDVAAALAREFSTPFAWQLASGEAATVTSFPCASVLWDDSFGGGPPYSEATIPFTVIDDHIIFAVPTYVSAGGKAPVDVRVVLAVNTGELTAVVPESGYEGTSHTIEGLEKTLTLTNRDWKDPINFGHVVDYAQDRLDSCKDAMVEGVVVYQGLYEPALAWGNGVSITGSDYETGWEGLNLPITDVEILWNSGAAYAHTTTMQLSNRRAFLSSGSFLAPSRNPGGQALGNASSSQQGNQGQFSPEAYAKRDKEAADARKFDDQTAKAIATGRRPPKPKVKDPNKNDDGTEKSDYEKTRDAAKELGWG